MIKLSPLILCLSFVFIIGSLNSCLNPQSTPNKGEVIAGMSASIVKSHPLIPTISIDQYRKDKTLILVDVRPQNERNISMIPGALTKEEFEIQRDNFKGKSVVFYATIGQRSSEYIKRLNPIFDSSFSLEEGILGWAQRSLPLVDPKGKETKKVHVYSEAWNLLNKPYIGVWND